MAFTSLLLPSALLLLSVRQKDHCCLASFYPAHELRTEPTLPVAQNLLSLKIAIYHKIALKKGVLNLPILAISSLTRSLQLSRFRSSTEGAFFTESAHWADSVIESRCPCVPPPNAIFFEASQNSNFENWEFWIQNSKFKIQNLIKILLSFIFISLL